MSNTETDADENSPLNLWRALRDYICAACAMFGAPAALAARRVVPRGEYKGFLPWLGMCEQLLRKHLFLDAVKLEPLAPPAPRRRDAGAGRRDAGQATPKRSFSFAQASGPQSNPFDPRNPESWKVSFKLGAHGAPASGPPAVQSQTPCRRARSRCGSKR